MKENFTEQFKSLKKIISNNISTLRELMAQSERLSEVINSLNNNENSELKKQLESLKHDISGSIDSLIEQTDDLFKIYEKLVEEVFGK